MEPKIHYGTTSGLTSGCISLSNGTSGLTLTAPSSYGTTITYSNQINNNMNQQQVKVAVFKVTRNKHNEIKSSEWVADFWIEKKPGVSIDYAVAKQLDTKYEADEIIIKEIYTVTL